MQAGQRKRLALRLEREPGRLVHLVDALGDVGPHRDPAGCRYPRASSRAISSACSAPSRSASFSMIAARSRTGVVRQVAKAASAATTARSTPASPASVMRPMISPRGGVADLDRLARRLLEPAVDERYCGCGPRRRSSGGRQSSSIGSRVQAGLRARSESVANLASNGHKVHRWQECPRQEPQVQLDHDAGDDPGEDRDPPAVPNEPITARDDVRWTSGTIANGMPKERSPATGRARSSARRRRRGSRSPGPSSRGAGPRAGSGAR